MPSNKLHLKILTIVLLAALNPGVVAVFMLLLLVGASIRDPMGGPLVWWSALKFLQQLFFFKYRYNFFF